MNTLTFEAEVEVCVDGVVAETIHNIGVSQEIVGTPNTMTHGVIITATPSTCYAIQHLELLAVVKVLQNKTQVARLTARFDEERHKTGPYDVFSDHAILVSQLDTHDTLVASSHYTRQWPRFWTDMRMEINLSSLSSLLSP